MKCFNLIIVFALLAFTGCFSQSGITKKVMTEESTIEKSLSDNKVPVNFNFSSERLVTVSLYSQNLSGSTIEIYSKDPAQGGKLLVKDTFDKSGNYNGSIVLGNELKSIFVKYNSGFTIEKLQVNDNKVIGHIKGSVAGIKRDETSADGELYLYKTYCFEDKWPAKGDYDFNDLVLTTQYRVKYDSNTKDVKSIIVKYRTLAAGASYVSGFGVALDIEKSVVANISGSNLTENVILLDNNGMEKNQEKPVAIFFDNARKQFTGEVPAFINTTRERDHGNDREPYYESISGQQMTITLKSNSQVNVDDIAKKINPFIFRTNKRSIEVHKKGYLPTSLADLALFNTSDDKSSQGFYQTENGWPWCIEVPADSYVVDSIYVVDSQAIWDSQYDWSDNYYNVFNYPREKQSIDTAYLKFVEWATSGGLNYPDWYTSNPWDYNDEYFDYLNMYFLWYWT